MVIQSELLAGNLSETVSHHPNGEDGRSRATQSSDDSTIETSSRVAVIERQSLMRECLVRSLSAATGWQVVAYDSAQAWLNMRDKAPVSLVVLCFGHPGAAHEDTANVALLPEIAALAPVALMTDSEAPSHIVGVLERHVRGYIPTSLPLHVAVEALRLVRAGGTYIPPRCLIASPKSQAGPDTSGATLSSMFTTRQSAVIAALRKGKANKIIAYELNMRESTVKVHVRNIMKKLKARNRTEVAYLANSMMAGDQR